MLKRNAAIAFTTLIVLLMILAAFTAAMAKAEETTPKTPRIWTDKEDYSPEETVTIYGEGFAPNAAITVNVTRPDGHVDSSLDIESKIVYKVTIIYQPEGTTDDEGNFTATYDLDGILGTYTVTATDATGNTATTTFTDADTNYKITFQVGGTISSDVGSVTVLTITGNTLRYHDLPKDFNLKEGTSQAIAASTPIDTSPASTKRYRFTGWSATAGSFGDASAASTTYTVPSSVATVTATYVTQYQVSFAVSPSGSGTTSPSGTGVWMDAGLHTISAVPNAGYAFSSWSSTGSITFANAAASSTTATINGAGTITANFVAADTTPPDTSITAGPTGWINVQSAAFSWTGSDDRTATANLVYSWRLDSGTWSAYSSATSTTLTGLSEGSHTFEVRAKDEAGNVDPTPATRSFSVDITPPSISASVSPSANAAGWHKTDVTVTFSASDVGGSGIASVTSPITVTTEGASQVITGSATDYAGNIASTSVILNIDKTPPTITASRSPDANSWGWNNVDVTVSFDTSDGLSGIDPGTDPADVVVSSEGSGQSVTGTVYDKAGNSASATVSNINIDKTPPTTTLTIGDPNSGTNPTYVSTTTQFTLSASDSTSGVDIIQYQFVAHGGSIGSSWTTYSSAFTAPGTGSYDLYYRSVDKAGNIETAKLVYIVVGATQLTYTGATSGQYSDPVTVSATLKDLATGNGISGKTITFTIGTQTVSATTGELGIATATITLNQQSGSYTVTASFAGGNGYLPSSDSKKFTINKETATIEYTGNIYVLTAGPTITTAPVQLSARVTQENDGYPGNLALAKVKFILTPNSGPSIEVANVPVDSVGNALATVNVPLGSYDITVDIEDGNLYWDSDVDASALTVDTGTGKQMVTGGGWIPYAESTNGKINFGFTVQYSKNGAPKGSFVAVFRSNDGYIYKIKSTSWSKGGLSFTDVNKAFFTATCVVQKIDRATGEVVESWGNFKIMVDITDGDYNLPQNGRADTIAIAVLDKDFVIWRQFGTSTSQIRLGGGNIVVHSK